MSARPRPLGALSAAIIEHLLAGRPLVAVHWPRGGRKMRPTPIAKETK